MRVRNLVQPLSPSPLFPPSFPFACARKLLCQLVPALLCASFFVDSAKPGKALEGVSESRARALMEDAVGSRVAEAVLSAGGREIADEFTARFVRGKLGELAAHPVANFVVQAALAAVHAPAQLKLLFDELQPLLPDLLRKRRSGVVGALVAAAARTGGGQKELCAALAAALAPLDDGGGGGVKAAAADNDDDDDDSSSSSSSDDSDNSDSGDEESNKKKRKKQVHKEEESKRGKARGVVAGGTAAAAAADDDSSLAPQTVARLAPALLTLDTNARMHATSTSSAAVSSGSGASGGGGGGWGHHGDPAFSAKLSPTGTRHTQ